MSEINYTERSYFKFGKSIFSQQMNILNFLDRRTNETGPLGWESVRGSDNPSFPIGISIVLFYSDTVTVDAVT